MGKSSVDGFGELGADVDEESFLVPEGGPSAVDFLLGLLHEWGEGVGADGEHSDIAVVVFDLDVVGHLKRICLNWSMNVNPN